MKIREYRIEPAEEKDWQPAMELAYKTFLQYEAKEYGENGTRKFAEFVSDERLKNFFLAGEYKLFVARKEGEVVGMISLRSGNHISLLFVDTEYHRCGIGRHLVTYLQEYMLKNTIYSKVTVHAAPYAVPFYHTLGFRDTGTVTRQDDIIFTPMEFYL